MAPDLQVPSFAKINWSLVIEGRRQDGYHQITTLLQTVDLADRLTFQLTDDSAIVVRVTGREVPSGPDNLAYRAAACLRERTRTAKGLHIVLEKNIPPGGGLGGGSSNAAITLLAANRLWDLGLSAGELVRLGSQLGTDVPFFLYGGTALATGRGVQMFPLPDCGPKHPLILLYPGFPILTREAYASGNWGEYEGAAVLTSKRLENKIQRFQEAMAQGLNDLSWLENDFEKVVYRLYPALKEGRRRLVAAGCRHAMLCGSGSTLFGVLEPGRGEEIARGVSQTAAGETFVCQSLSRQEYTDFFARSGLDLATSTD